MIGPSAAGLAATGRGIFELKKLEMALIRMANNDYMSDLAYAAQQDFHDTVFSASQNEALFTSRRFIAHLRFWNIQSHFKGPYSHLNNIYRAFYEAIEASDVDGASSAM